MKRTHLKSIGFHSGVATGAPPGGLLGPVLVLVPSRHHAHDHKLYNAAAQEQQRQQVPGVQGRRTRARRLGRGEEERGEGGRQEQDPRDQGGVRVDPEGENGAGDEQDVGEEDAEEEGVEAPEEVELQGQAAVVAWKGRRHVWYLLI